MGKQTTTETDTTNYSAEPESGGGAGGTGGGKSYNGGGDGNGNEGEGRYWEEVSPFLAGLSRGIDAFPQDLRTEILSGMVPLMYVRRYVELQASMVMNMLMKLPGLRNKLLADPSLVFKLGIELGIGIFTKCSAEYQKRAPHFREEMDFVVANVLMALVADYMLVYVAAPTVVFNATRARKLGVFKRLFPSMRSFPKNAFQKVPMGMAPFTPLQRLGAISINGTKLFGIGAFASFVGVEITNTLIRTREKLAPDAPPSSHKPQDVVGTSLLYGAYMGISSNLRYQALAGVEERLLTKIFPQATSFTAASACLRIANTYLGSLLWVDTLRMVGMQPKEH